MIGCLQYHARQSYLRGTRMHRAVYQGTCVVPGIAEGVLRFFDPSWAVGAAQPPRQPAADSDAEVGRYQQEATLLASDLEEAARQLDTDALHQEADFVRRHALMLADGELSRQIEHAIRQDRVTASEASGRILRTRASEFEQSQFPGLADRAAEFNDLAIQLRRRLADRAAEARIEAGGMGVIWAARELLPSLVLEARQHGARGFVIEHGTPYSHAAILARSFALPVVRMPAMETLRSHEGEHIQVDATRGELVLTETLVRPPSPSQTIVPVQSREQSPVRLWVSIANPDQLKELDWSGVEGVGLFRTEAMFLAHGHDFLREAEQRAVYTRLFELCGGRPVTVRTLDVGADKVLPYMPREAEDNPQLGLRAHRMFHFHPELLITQVRAILQAAHGTAQLRILYPMIESIEQWRFIRRLTDDAIATLHSTDTPFQERFERGPLVETPSAAWGFARLLRESDFAAIGSNDLVQYLFAVDRNNASVAHLYRPEHPVVLRVLRTLADEARAAGKPLLLCGEIASDTKLLPVLVGLGLEHFSVTAGMSPQVRRFLVQLSVPECRELANRCLEADEADEVQDIIADWRDDHLRGAAPSMASSQPARPSGAMNR